MSPSSRLLDSEGSPFRFRKKFTLGHFFHNILGKDHMAVFIVLIFVFFRVFDFSRIMRHLNYKMFIIKDKFTQILNKQIQNSRIESNLISILHNRRGTQQMNQTIDQTQFSRSKQNSVDILFKGLKRKISQQSYSKLKNSYKKKPIQLRQPNVSFGISLLSRTRPRLNIVQNKVTDPKQAHQQLLRLKETNHKLFQQNTELLRKIRKEEKIQEIYRKKLQGKDLIELDHWKALQIKLLLQVQSLEASLQQKQSLLISKSNFIRSKKHSFGNQIFDKRVEMYDLLIENQEDLAKIEKQKQSILSKKVSALGNISQKLVGIRTSKQEKSEELSKIRAEIKQLQQKFRQVEAQSKRDKNSSQLINITSLMSSLMTNAQRQQSMVNKQTSTAILKNNMSSISVKNRNNIDELQKQIEKIKGEYNLINTEIQEFMDQKIKQKILIHKEIREIEENERKQRQIQNKSNICQNSSLGRNQIKLTNSRVDPFSNPLRCSIVME